MSRRNTRENGPPWPAALGGAVVLGLLATAAARAEEPIVRRNVESFAPVAAFVFNGDLRSLPKAPDWQPGDPIKEIPRRGTKTPATPLPDPPRVDPLLARQAALKNPTVIGPPILNFNGGGFSGVTPPDTVGDVGPNHYIQLINFNSGTQVRIYDKSGNLISGPTALDSLGTGLCANGLGDPVVLYDQFADRWLLTEFSSSGNRMCVYVSQTGDPVAGGYFAYQFTGTNFPDYPKYGIWPDAYYAGTNESTAAAYVFGPRSSMLTGAAASQQRFQVLPPLSGFAFEGIQPADADGTLQPPAGAPGTFWRHNDSESHGNPGGPDLVQYYEFHVDFATPANSTFTGPLNITVSEFDSNTCNFSFNCVPQPGTGVTLDPLREPVMHRVQYRNFGTHQAVVGSFMTDVGVNQHEVRWFEMRKIGANPYTLFQEGTIGADTTHRWMSSIAMDGFGNIGIGYNVSSSSVFPGIRYTGRVATDPPGMMAPEQTIIDGTASNSNSRYGDYSSLNVDPSTECTFWWTGEYNTSGNWSTRIATFTFPVPECIPIPVELQSFVVE